MQILHFFFLNTEMLQSYIQKGLHLELLLDL